MGSALARAQSVPPGRREKRKLTTRRDLLQAGTALFGEKGLYESRVEDLTVHAGIAKGTLYRYFRTKDELIRAVVEEAFAQLGRRVAERVQDSREPSALFARIVDAHLEFYAESPDLMRVLHQARGMLKFNHREWRPLRTSLLRHLDYLSRLIRQVHRRRPPSRPRCRELAVVLFGAASGVASVQEAANPARARGSRPRPLVSTLAQMVSRYSATHPTPARAGPPRPMTPSRSPRAMSRADEARTSVRAS